jgi:hypothetical protein
MSKRREIQELYRDEAERLAQLPRDLQRAAVAAVREEASNPAWSPARRRDARERADFLARTLKHLNRQNKAR